MQFANHVNYPPYIEGEKYGFFGYPSAMLDMAIARDDIYGFNFYLSRYFSDKPEVFGEREKPLSNYVRLKGLGRDFSWREMLEFDDKQTKMFDDDFSTAEIPCGCYDG